MNIERENIFTNQSTLMQIVNDNSILIYQKATELNHVEELLKGGEINESEKLIIISPFESFNIFPNPVRNVLYVTQGKKN